MDEDSPKDIVLRTKSLSKKFGRRWAAKDVRLEVFRGDVFGFLGPNGAGKSTTIRMILSLLRPTAGSVELFGQDLQKNRRSVLTRVCGIVEKADFYPYLSAYTNLEILGSLTRAIRKEEILDVLTLVGLKPRTFDKVKTFSHGMKQRLGIAQALLTQPELIILDEPTSGLDPMGMKEVREMITVLSAERHMTVFLSSHLLSEVEQVATRMAVINRGEIIAQGGVTELLGNEPMQFSIDVSPVDAAVELMKSLAWVEILSRQDSKVEVRLEPARSAELNRLLVTNNLDVSGLYPHRTLEEFFLKITEGATEG